MSGTVSAALSPAQHKARLWADDARFVYAVVMGSRVPNLPSTLAQADIAEHDCLLPGALPPEQQRSAPYLIELLRDSAFTDWLLFDAAGSLGEWGLLALSPERRLVVRAHLRELMLARLPDGTEIDWPWMDPEVLAALLPLFDGAGLARFMGPLTALVLPGASLWTFAEPASGQLQWRRVPLAQEV